MVSHPGSAYIWKTLAPLNLRRQIKGAITRIQNLTRAAGQKPSGKVGISGGGLQLISNSIQ